MEDEDKVADAAEIVVSDKYEDEAKSFGWKPEDEFTGEGHMNAEKFMTRGPGTSRKLSATVDNQDKSIVKLEQAIVDQKNSFIRMEAAQKSNMEDRIEARAEEMAKVTREAAESGDMEKYDELVKKTKVEKPKVDETPPDIKAAMDSWLPDNMWFNTDRVANRNVIDWFDECYRGGMSAKDAIDEATSRVKSAHPYLFPKEVKKRQTASVESGGIIARTTSEKGWSDVPADHKKSVEEEIASGLWDAGAKKLNITAKEAFAKKYWEQDNA